MHQSAASFFGFWEGVRGSQYQNRLPDAPMLHRFVLAGSGMASGPPAGGAAGPPVMGNVWPGASGPPVIGDYLCTQRAQLPTVVASGDPMDCDRYCINGAETISDYAGCLFNCYGGALGTSCECPGGDGPYFPLPDFQQIHVVTRLCFILQYGDAEWPDTCCCPPPLNATPDCSPPSLVECAWMVNAIPCREWDVTDGDPAILPKRPTIHDQQLFGAGVAILIKNLDVILWLLCMVQNWSPEFSGVKKIAASRLILQLLTDQAHGQLPWTVTYVNRSADGDADMWAFMYVRRSSDQTVGLVIPLESSMWIKRVNQWSLGGLEAFCAAVSVASEMLHELVHIVGDGFDSGTRGAEDLIYPTDGIHGADPIHNINEVGAYHESYKDPVTGYKKSYGLCWDEARMVGTMFLWAMSQRYTCLQSAGYCCRNMGETEFFAYSTSTLSQLGAPC